MILAAAGLLHGETAATHWLAGGLLQRFGSIADARRLVDAGGVITCSGMLSAVDAALALAERVEGSHSIERIKAELLAAGAAHLQPDPWWRPLAWLLRVRRDSDATSESRQQVEGGVTPLSVMIELVEDELLVTRLRRQSGRRSH